VIVATGRTTKLTGALGEYLVAAELSRRGLIAAPFAGNVPHFDVLAAAEDGRQFAIQVKTSNGNNWQFGAQTFLHIEFDGNRQIIGRVQREPLPGLICVLVKVTEGERDRFFVMKWTDLRSIIAAKYRAYLKKHSGRRPRSPESYHTKADLPEVLKFENAWESVLK
jgi:hypothetical protein